MLPIIGCGVFAIVIITLWLMSWRLFRVRPDGFKNPWKFAWHSNNVVTTFATLGTLALVVFCCLACMFIMDTRVGYMVEWAELANNHIAYTELLTEDDEALDRYLEGAVQEYNERVLYHRARQKDFMYDVYYYDAMDFEDLPLIGEGQ